MKIERLWIVQLLLSAQIDYASTDLFVNFRFSLAAITLNFEPIYKKAKLQFIVNRRGGTNLAYNGFMYTAERKYKTTTNWVCNKNSNTTLRCPARCVTSNDTIKLSRKGHNHGPVFWFTKKN